MDDSSILCLAIRNIAFSLQKVVQGQQIADTFQQWRPRFNTGDTLKYSGVVPRLHAGTWFEWQITRSRCGLRHSFDCTTAVEEREKGWNGPRMVGAWSHCLCSVLTLEGDLHSRRQSSPACGASRPARLRHAKARLQSERPKHRHMLNHPRRLMITEDALPAHGTRPSRKCDIGLTMFAWCVSRHPKMSSRCKGV